MKTYIIQLKDGLNREVVNVGGFNFYQNPGPITLSDEEATRVQEAIAARGVRVEGANLVTFKHNGELRDGERPFADFVVFKPEEAPFVEPEPDEPTDPVTPDEPEPDEPKKD